MEILLQSSSTDCLFTKVNGNAKANTTKEKWKKVVIFVETYSWSLLCLTSAQSFKTSWSTTDFLVSHAICLCRFAFCRNSLLLIFKAKQSIDSYENGRKPFSLGAGRGDASNRVHNVSEKDQLITQTFTSDPRSLTATFSNDVKASYPKVREPSASSVSQRWKTSRGQLIQDPGDIRPTLSPIQSTQENNIVSAEFWEMLRLKSQQQEPSKQQLCQDWWSMVRYWSKNIDASSQSRTDTKGKKYIYI